MLHVALTLWYTVTALLGPYLCCWVRCETASPAPQVALGTPTVVPKEHSCCSEEAPAPIPVSTPDDPCSPQKPTCPYCQKQILESQAILASPTLALDDLLDHPQAISNDVLSLEVPFVVAATVAESRTGPPAPFPSAYDLICVFHIMRC